MKLQIILTFLLILLLAGCGSDMSESSGSGFLEANEVTLSAENSGRVLDLKVDEGDRIKTGDTVLVIDPSRVELEMKAAEAGYRVAEADLSTARVQLETARTSANFAKKEKDRVARLLKSGTATQKTYDKLEFEYDQAELARRTAETRIMTLEAKLEKLAADIDLIKRVLDDAHPTSPINGIVVEKFVESGELLNPGKPMVRIASLDTLWVKVYLPAAQFSKIKLNDKVMIDTESGEQQYDGVVVWTSEEAEFTPKNVQTAKSRANLVYAVKVQIPNVDGRLKIGMPVFCSLGE